MTLNGLGVSPGVGVGCGTGVATTSTTIWRRGVGRGVGPASGTRAVGITPGTRTSISDDRSTSGPVRTDRVVRDSLSIRTETPGVTVGGTSAGVGKDCETAGSGAAGGGSSTAESSEGRSSGRPNRPA